MNVRCRVELSHAERAEFRALLSGGKQTARKLERAQILLSRRPRAPVGGRRSGSDFSCR